MLHVVRHGYSPTSCSRLPLVPLLETWTRSYGERREMSACPVDPSEAPKAHVPGTEPAATKTTTDYVLVVELERLLGSLLPRLGQRQRKGNTRRLGIFNNHTGDVIELSTIQSRGRPYIHRPCFHSPRTGAPGRYFIFSSLPPFSTHSHIGL